MTKRHEWTVLGRVIGTATDWDQADTFSMQVYGLEPAGGIPIPPGDVVIDFEGGWLKWTDEAGDHRADLIEALQGLPRA